MVEHRNLEDNARAFVIDALTEFSGCEPGEQAVNSAVESIVRAFGSVVSSLEPLASEAELQTNG